MSGGGGGRGGGRGGRSARGSGRGRGGPRKRSHNDDDDSSNNNNSVDGRGRTGGRGTGRGRGSGGQQQQQQQQQGQGQQQHGRLIRISKVLSWALRHGAAELGLTMTPDGFCPVQQIIQHSKYKSLKMTVDEVQQVVTTNDKQRFKLEERPARDYQQSQQQNNKDTFGTSDEAVAVANDDGTLILCIRANQGHSLKGGIIDPHLLLKPLSPENLANTPVIVHGTYMDAWQKIQQSGGLKRMNRHHIHFATGLPNGDGVISGMRHSSQVYIYIHGAKCARDGIVFFQSENGVLLTAGTSTTDGGLLPIAYFSHVMDNMGNVLLDQRDDGRNE
jgi:2'-phosphotransferase